MSDPVISHIGKMLEKLSFFQIRAVYMVVRELYLMKEGNDNGEDIDSDDT